jgi:hypothetical protein
MLGHVLLLSQVTVHHRAATAGTAGLEIDQQEGSVATTDALFAQQVEQQVSNLLAGLAPRIYSRVTQAIGTSS